MKLKTSIERIFSNSDARALLTNFASLSLLKLIGFIFPLITLPYLSRIIGPDGFGEIAFAAAVVIYFETITDFGFNYTATRDIARVRGNINEVSRIFSNIFYAKLLLMFISILIFIICVSFIPFLNDKKTILWLTFLYIPGHIIFPEWFFQAQEKMVYITIINFISKLFFTVLIFVVITESNDYIYQPLLTACGYWISGIISLFIIHKKFGIQLLKPKWLEIGNTIKASSNMFISLFLPNLYSNLSTILLRTFHGSGATGIYSNGYRFIGLTDQLSQILSRTFYPFLARRMDKHTLYVRISGFICICASILLFTGARYIVGFFYTKEFYDAMVVIKIMAVAPIGLFLMNTYGPNYLVLNGGERIYRNLIVCFSISGSILTIFMTYKYSFIGVAVSMTTIWMLRGLTTYYYANMLKNKQNLQKSKLIYITNGAETINASK